VHFFLYSVLFSLYGVLIFYAVIVSPHAVLFCYIIYISWRVDNYKSDVYKDENTISRLKHRLVEQELPTLPEHLSSPPVFSGFVLLDL
jgi:hypothetical protein